MSSKTAKSGKSGKNFGKLLDLYKELTPNELSIFTSLVRDMARDKAFNLDDLMKVKADDGIRCPRCNHAEPKSIVKYGVRRGIQCYRCKSCERTFSATTGTFLQGTKKFFQTWEDFAQCMLEGHSVRRTAEVCCIHRNTAWVWRHKLLDALTQYQDSQARMKGVVEADDTFFQLSFKGSTPIGRAAHRRGDLPRSEAPERESLCKLRRSR